ncbi:cell division protein FtsQ [Pedobacter nyackensis]|uniref:cell division protein FtsQ/DivIB n=1 Tax=Pedobacter nyackensis TaxID=475255 RepID=UPI00292D1966|nr:cell division protein FtsQ [Pedobacter nyackensis]
MLKRINWKLIFKCFAWVFCLTGMVVLMGFIDAKKKTVVCTKVKILIPGADNFIEREEIDAILKQSEGSLIGRNLAGINLQHIEKSIIANPYIAYATVYADMNGVIQISVQQRQPVLRVINSAGQDYYIDSDGLKMPVSPNFTANVLAANGNIMEHFSGKVDTLITKLAVDLYKVALYVKKDTLWDAQIEQLFVNNVKDIEMTPRLGNQRIILGSADSLETKMRNLRVFYKKAMPKVGWNTYKTINVKYINQIVCEKNKIDSITGEVIKERVPGETKKDNKVIDSIVRREIATDVKNRVVKIDTRNTINKLNKSI